jgi:hypothetical protein
MLRVTKSDKMRRTLPFSGARVELPSGQRNLSVWTHLQSSRCIMRIRRHQDADGGYKDQDWCPTQARESYSNGRLAWEAADFGS